MILAVKVLLSLLALLLMLWLGSYYSGRAWYTGKLDAISRFASRKVRRYHNHNDHDET